MAYANIRFFLYYRDSCAIVKVWYPIFMPVARCILRLQNTYCGRQTFRDQAMTVRYNRLNQHFLGLIKGFLGW